MLTDQRRERISRSLSVLDHALLCLLSANEEAPIKGKTALQKEMFLVANYLDRVNDIADFEPHLYGPYSESVENQMDLLIKNGLARRKGDYLELTDFGREIALHAASSFTEDERSAFDDFKEFLNDLTNDEILLFVYITYPDKAVESVVFSKILANRKSLAHSLFQKRKISLEKAAELAGSNIESFLDEARA